MSKIGKNYILSLKTSPRTSDISVFLDAVKKKKVEISNFNESYNSQLKAYIGKIEFSGSNIKDLKALQRLGKNYLGNYSNTKFSIDTHYEELVEIKNVQVSTGITSSTVSLADSVEVYKYRNPLEYNFLVRNYEDFLKQNPNINERALPYFYDVLSDFITKDNYQQFSGTNFFETPKDVITQNDSQELTTNIIPSEVIVDDKKLRIDKYLERFNVYKEQFPFYADVVFDTHELDEKSIISALQDKDLYPPLMERILKQSQQVSLNVSSPITNTTSIFAQELDIKEFLYEQLNNFAETDFTFIFDINQRVDNKARTFLEVLNDEEEYCEVIGYHLKKFNGNTANLIQEWYLPNVGEGQFNWIDSQIKYDKLYTYKLDLVVLTFATEYTIQNIELEKNKLVLNFINKPLIKSYIIKSDVNSARTTLGATYTNKLLDFPPLEPEVELVPYIGVDNQIKINLNTSTGMKTVPAINFDPSEETRKDELRAAQNKDINSDLLTFQTDEPSDFIEIYRIDFKPKSYNDFFGNRIVSLSTNGSSGASFVDDILPNKKYYYIARAIDYHGNISNPTTVYELEMLNDNGLIVPFINFVEFDKDESDKEESKAFKRFLKLQPALAHRLINTIKTDQNNIELGQLEIAPWNRNFKLRLTSKSTGKKIDINFTFKYKKPQ